MGFLTAKSLLMNALSSKPVLRPGPRRGLGALPVDQSRFVTRLRHAAWDRMPKPFLLNWVKDIHLYVTSGDESLLAVFLTGEVDPNEFCFLDGVLKPGMTFVDVGANLGLYSLFAAKKVGQSGTVVAIEPSTREFRKLHKNVKINGANNCRVLKLAVSDHAGEATLKIASEFHAGHNTLSSFVYDHTSLACTEIVRTEKLDDIVRQQGLPSVDFIKIDVEGMEAPVLAGATETLSRFHPVLLVEISNPAFPTHSSLESLGYELLEFDSVTGVPIIAKELGQSEAVNLIARPNKLSRVPHAP